MAHLINNPAIDQGDALLVYFAGHGSTIPAPKGWYGGVSPENRDVQVICPYDHDTKQFGKRVAGISDRSMLALLNELARVKGNNITFIADCCFSPPKAKSLDRKFTRSTPTIKCKPDDLYYGLWSGARGVPNVNRDGFYAWNCGTHVFLSACRPDGIACEGKNGGKFTNSFLEAALELSLHRTSYNLLLDHILRDFRSEDEQRPLCVGKHNSHIVFDGVPFSIDPKFILVDFANSSQPCLDVGAVHGIAKGSELSLHFHNHFGSRNPVIGTLIVSKVEATKCFGHVKAPIPYCPKLCWAKIVRWNNRRPFRVHLKKSLTSLCSWWKLRRSLPTVAGGPASIGGLNVIRVKNSKEANITMTIGHDDITVITKEQPANQAQLISRIRDRGPANVIDDAARFNLHLSRQNPEGPLNGLIHMELFRMNHTSWSPIGENLLRNGKAVITFEEGAIFKVVIRNDSPYDLWPYLFFMDPASFSITKVYDPESSPQNFAPLLRGRQLSIGTGRPGSEALSFQLGHDSSHHSGYLKLFLTSNPVPFSIIEQGHPSEYSFFYDREFSRSPCILTGQVWDTLSGFLKFMEG
ncbi:hypothetical protein H0H93_005830 [Arthromyces matolae]|nr:hypothetical protein H0H93_005830 [Arthromyces matolae]